jgi:D-amino peptidase
MTLQELDASFSAVLLVGYHAGAGAGASPLEHTYTGNFRYVKLNGEYISEFTLDAYTAAYKKVPLVFVSGDKGLCEQVARMNPHIQTVAVKEGVGASTINLHPALAVEQIRAGAALALQGDLQRCSVALPERFSMEVCYRRHTQAYQLGFYPGARQVDLYTVYFEASDYFEVLRFFMFAMG